MFFASYCHYFLDDLVDFDPLSSMKYVKLITCFV